MPPRPLPVRDWLNPHTAAAGQTFGQRMRTLRDAQDKSLTKLCEESNVSRGYLGNLERDRSVVWPKTPSMQVKPHGGIRG